MDKKYKESGSIGLIDSRAVNSGITRKRELTLEEELKRVKAKNLMLQAEIELLGNQV